MEIPTLAGLGSIITTRELRKAGLRRRGVQAAIDAGLVSRIRSGWFASADAPPAIVHAVRVGGSLTCVSATSVLGMWTPPVPDLHLALVRGDRHLRHPHTGRPLAEPLRAGVIVHWNSPTGLDASRGILSVVDCMLDVLRCQPADMAFAILESGLRLRSISALDRAELLTRAPRRHAALIAKAAEKADAGTESLFRFRCEALGVAMHSQVVVPGVGRVDFVIGDRILVEIDSSAHHGTSAQRRRDLERDAIAVGLGFITLRFDYHQIMYDWATVEATVMSLIGRGEHLSSSRRTQSR